MKKSIVCAFALAGLASSAQAADLDAVGLKDPIPDTLSFHGVTVYGTVDVGYAYQTNGAPLGGSFPPGLNFNPDTSSRNLTGKSLSTLAEGGLEQSKIGVKIEEEIGYGWLAIGKLDTGFSPLSGELTDNCASIIRNNGKPYAQTTANGDGSRCGQALNGSAYAGVSNASYGTLTIGRQNSLELEALSTYDPMGLSYAFSLVGYSGTNAGVGSTETARWDNSAKYVYEYGPLHAAVMYADGGQDSSIWGKAYGFDVGGKYRNFSIDATYTKENNAVNARDAANGVLGSNTIAAYLSDNEAWSVMGKYTFDFGGSFKDEAPGSKLTLYGGYTHVEKTNGSGPTSGTTIGGYQVSITPNYIYPGSTQTIQYAWTGAKYELPSGWSFTGAYYYEDRSNFLKKSAAGTCPAASDSNCAGNLNQGSFVVDYQFNKHLDVYAGVDYAIVANGMASTFAGSQNPTNYPANPKGTATTVDQTTFMTGMRLKF
jgi:predicted porin